MTKSCKDVDTAESAVSTRGIVEYAIDLAKTARSASWDKSVKHSPLKSQNEWNASKTREHTPAR